MPILRIYRIPSQKLHRDGEVIGRGKLRTTGILKKRIRTIVTDYSIAPFGQDAANALNKYLKKNKGMKNPEKYLKDSNAKIALCNFDTNEEFFGTDISASDENVKKQFELAEKAGVI